MSPPAKGKALPLHKSIAASAIAACTAEVSTAKESSNPLIIDQAQYRDSDYPCRL